MATPLAIVSDSTADIPAPLAEERQIHIAPMHIVWEGRDYLDHIDMSAEEFYARLVSTRIMPTTSQPSLNEYAEAFQQARDATDAEAVVVMTISSKLSGSFNAACEAAKMVDFPVIPVDTFTGSIAHGLAALRLADIRDAGVPLEQAIAFANTIASKTKMIFALDTLEYLYRSGRVSNMQRILGQALQIKPLLHVKDGGISMLEQVRTRKNMMKCLIKVFEQALDRSKPAYIGVLHGGAADDVQVLINQIKQRCQPKSLIVNTVCAPVGVHTGPGALGFAILQE